MTDITDGRRLAGASVLPYSCDPSHNNIYFLLGAERKLPRWHDSSKWSDFGGAPKKKKGFVENDAECAGRFSRKLRKSDKESCKPKARFKNVNSQFFLFKNQIDYTTQVNFKMKTVEF